ncbi:hypothetical protein PF001_g11073 [Phytophthora fragariae]|uniref:Uncharacterized protein n=1 Tax=Phytophthora fragariae TaxID=53985 RepID=A0A6A4DHM6_9STRA|nr:hypothetical protein PF001_g11073 [Phytophthora fragariae]
MKSFMSSTRWLKSARAFAAPECIQGSSLWAPRGRSPLSRPRPADVVGVNILEGDMPSSPGTFTSVSSAYVAQDREVHNFLDLPYLGILMTTRRPMLFSTVVYTLTKTPSPETSPRAHPSIYHAALDVHHLGKLSLTHGTSVVALDLTVHRPPTSHADSVR